jgi:hypothetical protein
MWRHTKSQVEQIFKNHDFISSWFWHSFCTKRLGPTLSKVLKTLQHPNTLPATIQEAKVKGHCRSSFTTLPPVLLQEHPVVVLLLERALVSWSLAMDKCDGHEDLCGSGRRSVISYVYGRTELYCTSLPYMSVFLFVFYPCEESPARAFYSSRSVSYIETWGPTGGPEVVETPYSN